MWLCDLMQMFLFVKMNKSLSLTCCFNSDKKKKMFRTDIVIKDQNVFVHLLTGVYLLFLTSQRERERESHVHFHRGIKQITLQFIQKDNKTTLGNIIMTQNSKIIIRAFIKI